MSEERGKNFPLASNLFIPKVGVVIGKAQEIFAKMLFGQTVTEEERAFMDSVFAPTEDCPMCGGSGQVEIVEGD